MRLPDSISTDTRSQWVLRPAVVAVFVYGTILRLASIYFHGTLRFPDGSEDPTYGAIWDRLGAGLTALNFALAALLVHELWLARTRGAALRRAHFAGALLGLAYLGVLQWLILRSPEVFAAPAPSLLLWL